MTKTLALTATLVSLVFVFVSLAIGFTLSPAGIGPAVCFVVMLGSMLGFVGFLIAWSMAGSNR